MGTPQDDLPINNERSELKGLLGLVAHLVRSAIELAEGRNLFREPQQPHVARDLARQWLRDGGWELLVSAAGCDPDILRSELERRFEWMHLESAKLDSPIPKI